MTLSIQSNCEEIFAKTTQKQGMIKLLKYPKNELEVDFLDARKINFNFSFGYEMLDTYKTRILRFLHRIVCYTMVIEQSRHIYCKKKECGRVT